MAIAQEEVVQRQFTPHGATAQHQPRIQRQQQRRCVTNRRSVGDIAPQRALVADLLRSKTRQQFAKGRVVVSQQRVKVTQRRPGTNNQTIVVPTNLF
ncbi:hypothetical protein D3C73_1279610 [compost metagenome]